jgi:hypothetical protein
VPTYVYVPTHRPAHVYVPAHRPVHVPTYGRGHRHVGPVTVIAPAHRRVVVGAPAAAIAAAPVASETGTVGAPIEPVAAVQNGQTQVVAAAPADAGQQGAPIEVPAVAPPVTQ